MTIRFAALALAVATGCAAGRGAGRFQGVSDADFGRLAPGQLQPVNSARASAAAAHDAVARAELRAQGARSEADYARADQTAVKADVERAAAAAKLAGQSRDPGDLARAQELQAAAELRKQAADAHLAYAEQLAKARKADVAAARAEEDRANAAVDRAKLTALEQAQIPAATRYDPARFDERLADATRAAQEARAKAEEEDRATLQALGSWQTLQQRWQARTGAVGGSG